MLDRAFVGDSLAQAQILVESSKMQMWKSINYPKVNLIPLTPCPACRDFCPAAQWIRVARSRTILIRINKACQTVWFSDRMSGKERWPTYSSWYCSPISTKFLKRDARPKLFVGVWSMAWSWSVFLRAFPYLASRLLACVETRWCELLPAAELATLVLWVLLDSELEGSDCASCCCAERFWVSIT